MTVLEMHIEVEHALQTISANTTRTFTPEEIDWTLNKVQDNLISLNLRPKLDSTGKPVSVVLIDQIATDLLRGITRKYHSSTLLLSKGIASMLLPTDYMHLLGDSSEIEFSCSKTPGITETEMLYCKIDVRDLPGDAPYKDFSIVTEDVSITSTDLLPSSFIGYIDKQYAISQFVNLWMEELEATGLKCYWEYSPFETYNRGFLYVLTATIDIEVEGVTLITVQKAHTSYRTLEQTTTSKRIGNRLLSSASIREYENVAFYDTSKNSPISELTKYSLEVKLKNFITTGIEITYLKKPIQISLPLNRSCELVSGHSTICTLAVEYLKNHLNDVEGYKLENNYINERVNL